VQAYTRNIVGPEGIRPPRAEVEKTLTEWEYFPPAAGIGVRAAWELSEHVPVMVTENGIATQNDPRRIDYTRGALEGLHDCIEDGIELLGYQHWSALDNYEWASGYAPTFGLIAWDKQTFARTPKPSAAWYGEVARANGL
jgi:beta-glucosidase